MSLETLNDFDHFSIVFGEGPDAVDIGKMVDAVTSINRGIGNQWNNEYTRGVGRYGQSWVRGTLSSKIISFDFIKEGDQVELTQFRRDMAAALDCPRGPKKLTFNDQPNTYYMAVTDGSISLREDIRTMQATGTITFVVPDGLLHSSITTVLNKDSDPDIGYVKENGDHVEVAINNPSSVDIYPKISITHKVENGWIGIVNQNGVLEIGSKEATAQGESILSDSVTSKTVLRVKQGEESQWSLFKTEETDVGSFITAPHDSNMSARVGKMGYSSRDIAFSVGNPVTNPKPSSTYSVGSVPQRTKTYMGQTEAKGFAAKLVVTYKSTNINTRTSIVHADLYIVNVTRINSFTMWDINYTVKIGNTSINHASRPNMAPQYGGVWEEHVMSNDFTVPHGADGSAIVNVLGAINGRNQAYYVPGYFQTAGTFELPKIIQNQVTPNPSTSTVNGFERYDQRVSGLSWIKESIPSSAYKWAGAMALYTLPVDSEGNIITARNFRCDFNVKFWQNDVGQTGRITVGFLDKNDQLICAYDIAKDDQNGEETKVNFYTGKDDIIGTQTFGANNNEKNQSKPNIAFNNKTGNVSVIKEGSKITFTYGDKPFSFNVSKLDKKECAKIYISAGALFAARNINKLVYLMTVESIAFSNNNSQRYDSLPNRYREDTKLVIDLHEGEIWLHNNTSSLLGQRAQSELVHGSRYFAVPKGTSYLKVYPSPWSKSLPDVELEWKDSWL